MSGFIAMSRDALDHPLLQDGEHFRAWFWLVSKACWKPTRHDVNGKIVTLERGQFSTSLRQLEPHGDGQNRRLIGFWAV